MIKKKAIMLAGILLAGLALAIVVIGGSGRWRSKASRVSNTVIGAAQDTRLLKERAKEEGHFRKVQNPKSERVYNDLADLARQSSMVVIGTPERNMSVLSRDGRSISLDYTVLIEHVYKGKFQAGNSITVRLPGGRIKFDDGSLAEVTTPWFKKMQNGKTYALFLASEAEGGVFLTTGEAQGIFEIPTTEAVRAVRVHSGLQESSIRKYEGQDVKVFLGELRRATGKALKGSN